MTLKPLNKPIQVGDQYITRVGQTVRIICIDAFSIENNYPIIGLLKKTDTSSEESIFFTENGKYFKNQETEFDLFVPLIKKSGWVNIYPQSLSDSPIRTSRVYLTEKDALEHKDPGCIDTIKIHWEE